MTENLDSSDVPLFDTVLVANRGEIACRIIRTLRRLGIRSAAVYSDADAGARHVREADVAVRLGPAAPQHSYLSIDALLAACKATGAGAVHPGYGFLSENESFARALGTAGITFIGPGTTALRVMGDKIRAKAQVASYGVPVVPGTNGSGLDDDKLVAAAAELGFPVLIKPSAGGGGKGMQAVTRAADLPDALAAARRVAGSAFGDETLLLEKLIANPRHIEIQVLADRHGNVIHLGERECSLQRRHQKVIEEAPSPLLDPATRARMGEAACNAARSVDYTGAGTVEFLVSADNPDTFYFMEMNTRLQVEHPVTEMVTGLDLVEWQLRIAAGRPLDLAQPDVALHGHAVEARIYAEAPAHDFLPTGGTVLALAEPAGEGLRVDSSLLPGLDMSTSYDPMLAKVIAHADTRGQALDRLDAALARTLVLGVGTNIEYLRLLLADPRVRAGDLDTGLIERRLPGLAFRRPGTAELAAVGLYLQGRLTAGPARNPEPARSAEAGRKPGSPWATAIGWRLGGRPRYVEHAIAVPGAGTVAVRVTGGPDDAVVGVGDAPGQPAALHHLGGCRYQLTLAGITTGLDLVADGAGVWLGDAGWTAELTVRSRAELLAERLAAVSRPAGQADPTVRSPMPGTVEAMAVADGARVAAGQPLLSIEAMKMEHQLTAPLAGIVAVSLQTGDLVRADQVVAVITPDPAVRAPEEPASTGDADA